MHFYGLNIKDEENLIKNKYDLIIILIFSFQENYLNVLIFSCVY